MPQKSVVTLQELQAAKQSIGGRLHCLRKKRMSWRNRSTEKRSPIAAVGFFDQEIDAMDKILRDMKNRLDNAKITVEL